MAGVVRYSTVWFSPAEFVKNLIFFVFYLISGCSFYCNLFVSFFLELMCDVFGMFSMISFFFFEKTDIKRTTRTSNSQPHSGVLSGYTQVLKIWILKLTGQIVLGIRDVAFSVIF